MTPELKIKYNPRLYYLLTCPWKLWQDAKAQRDSGGEKYRDLRRRHVDTLVDILEFEEWTFIDSVFAVAKQDITLKSFGRKDFMGKASDWIHIPDKFEYWFKAEDIRAAFTEANKKGKVLVTLSTYQSNTKKTRGNKSCFNSLYFPYNHIHIRLVRNDPTHKGVIMTDTIRKSELECNLNRYQLLSNWEIPIIRHHLKGLDYVLNG